MHFLQSGHQKDLEINAKLAYNCDNLGFINFYYTLSANQMPQQKHILERDVVRNIVKVPQNRKASGEARDQEQ